MLSSDEEWDLPEDHLTTPQTGKAQLKEHKEKIKSASHDIHAGKSSNRENDNAQQKSVHPSTKVYTCKECSRRFTSRPSFGIHIQNHRKQVKGIKETRLTRKKVSCRWPLCPFIGLASDVKRHVDDVHGKPFLYPCLAEFCTILFTTRGNSFKHYKLVHKDDDEKEEVASKGQATDEKEEIDDNHTEEVTSESIPTVAHKTAHECKECNKAYSTIEGLRLHIITRHTRPKELTCTWQECSFVGHSQFALRRHTESVHRKLHKFPCPANNTADGQTCDKMYASKYKADLHYKQIHLKIRVPCSVASCEETFYNPELAREHYLLAHEGIQLKCTQCDKPFASYHTLRYHIRKVHKNIRHPCDQCGKSFVEKRHLRGHRSRIHKQLREVSIIKINPM